MNKFNHEGIVVTNLYRCKICGEAYVGELKPSHCPYCGAHSHWLIDAKDYVVPPIPELTEMSRKNLEFTYNLEVKASQIYHCIRKKTRDEFILGMFKAISKVELEHAELVSKLIDKDLGCEIPFKEELCTEDRKESLDKTKLLETNAINSYKQFLNEATEPRVKDIFQALIEVEQDHLDMVNAIL